MKFSSDQISGNGIVVAFCSQSGIARTAIEAEGIINQFKHANCCLSCNEVTRKYLTRLFACEEVSPTIRTTGCGPNDIKFFEALAPTIEGHNAICEAKLAEAREARLKAAKERTEALRTEFNVQKRGWYRVEVEVTALTIDSLRPRCFTASGYTVADSKIDAYNKMRDNEVVNMCAGKSCLFECCSEWNSSNTVVDFVGMKTDDGFSIDAWEEWNKSNSNCNLCLEQGL